MNRATRDEKMPGQPQCPQCGVVLPAGALGGLCPACLLQQGAAVESGPPPSPGAFVPLPVAEVARLFPQLEVLALLGAGGMGAVYKARQPALDRLVALKILPATGVGGASFAERFNREARALARLSHPNIVTVHEFGAAGSLHYFIMEFVDGANLRQLEQAGRLSPREALQIIPQICDALQYAHDEGVVHRDIKPENVLVDRKGRVKIADFGLAKILGHDSEAARLTAEGQVMGTPHYMAPEQVERPLSVDHRADIYSLGVVLYEMLTGDLPLGKFPPPSRKVQVDVRLDEVVLRALENDPARRYQHASQVKTDLATITATGDASASPAEADAPSNRQPASPPAAPPATVIYAAKKRKGEFLGLGAAVQAIGLACFFIPHVGFILGIVFLLIGGRMALKLICTRCGHRTNKHASICIACGAHFETAGLASATPSWLRGRFVLPVVLAVAVVWILVQQPATVSRVKRALRGGDSVMAAQVASFDPASGNMVAHLPGRGTVELLALADAETAPQAWWQPDGTPVTNGTMTAETFDLPIVPQTQRRTMILRLWDLPEGASGPMVEFIPAARLTSGGRVLRDGQRWQGAWPLLAVFPASARKATMQVGLGLDPWRTIATQRADGQFVFQRRQPGDPPWSVDFSREPAEARGDAQVSYVFGEQLRAWSHQLVAVDTNGVEHSPSRANATAMDKRMLYTVAFRELPLSAVKEFRLQVRSVHWVEFRDVALQPRQPLPPTVPVPADSLLESPAASGNAEATAVRTVAESFLAAIRRADDAALQSLAYESVPGWGKALPHFAGEIRRTLKERGVKGEVLTEIADVRVKDNWAAVKVPGPKEAGGIYLVLLFTRTTDGWRNGLLKNSAAHIPLEKHLDEYIASFGGKKPAP